MSVRWVAVVLLASCTGTPSQKPAAPAGPPASPPPPALPRYEVPPREPPAPFHVECHGFTPPPLPGPLPMRRKIYDFSPIELQPVRTGPRARDRDTRR